jgi:hypothetical protein
VNDLMIFHFASRLSLTAVPDKTSIISKGPCSLLCSFLNRRRVYMYLPLNITRSPVEYLGASARSVSVYCFIFLRLFSRVVRQSS